MEKSAQRVKVVLIAGYGRSGSTLLDLLLGQIDGFFSAGQVQGWARNFHQNWLCGCGKPLRTCEVWRAVAEEALGDIEKSERVAALQRSVASPRHLPRILCPVKTQSYRERLEQYSALLLELYRAIRKVSASRVIVDSSKVPAHALILNRMPEIDLRVIHLVRDSRAVAFSASRKKPNPGVHWDKAYTRTYTPVRAALGWSYTNFCTHMLRYVTPHYTFVRYEELAADPSATLSRLLATLGEPASALALEGRRIEFKRNHTCSGNVMRFQRGPIEIVPDTEWVGKMKKGNRLLATALSWPLLLRYAYLK